MMSPKNDQRTAVILGDDQYENLELHYPRLRLLEAGWSVHVAGAEANRSYASKEGYPVRSHGAFGDVNPTEVDALVVPGGYAPDKLRRHRSCLDLVKGVWDAGGIVAFICHAGWVPISAGIARGKRVTSVPAIRDDLINAGAEWLDSGFVVDGRMISAQGPGDLPPFMAAVLSAAEG
jgi:protease I